MRLRPVLWAAILVAAFVYVTSLSHWNVRNALRPLERAGKQWSEPQTARTAVFGADEQNNIDIYKMANAATVNITSIIYRENWFRQILPEQGQGSGFLIDEEGRILTNRHVVSGRAPEIYVTMADHKTRYKARILARDERNDLALIKVEPKQKAPFLRLGDSDVVQVGQKVIAIGNPFGLDGTLTTGVVSAVGRSVQTEEVDFEGMVQTDAAINPGNSGGPLLDSHGSVIGINTMIYGSQGNIGIGFAMPINRAKAMLEELRTRGRVTRPMLGVSVVYVSGDVSEALELPSDGGLLIQDVQRGSAAEEAGLRGPRQRVILGNYPVGIGGDLIVAIDGKPVEDRQSLERAMNRKRAGDNLELTVYRNRRTQKVTVKLGEAPLPL
ncbi:MAG: trypsin-like peptidase domain-containing protein [Acidobacteria bacterium]|nr:trypsin-like peptidase domain-containing protein [Acidobacteriota bacterium]